VFVCDETVKWTTYLIVFCARAIFSPPPKKYKVTSARDSRRLEFFFLSFYILFSLCPYPGFEKDNFAVTAAENHYNIYKWLQITAKTLYRDHALCNFDWILFLSAIRRDL